MDSEDTDVVLGALEKFDAACRAYTDAVCAQVGRDRPDLA
jgi:hypothetical protein